MKSTRASRIRSNISQKIQNSTPRTAPRAAAKASSAAHRPTGATASSAAATPASSATATPASSYSNSAPTDQVDVKWRESWHSDAVLEGNFGSTKVGLAAKFRSDSLGFKGDVDREWTDLNVRSTGRGDRTGKAEGLWAGENVDMDLRLKHENVDIDGKVGGKRVSLDIDRTDSGYDISGNWKGSNVQVGVTEGDGCSHWMHGRWGNSEVNLVQNDCTGETTGKAPKEMMLPWLLGNIATGE